MYTYIYMASVNISLKQEAYERLASIKKPDESFSDEILRLTQTKTAASLMEFRGAWKDMPKGDIKEMDAAIKSGRRKTSETAEKWKL